MKKWVLLVGLAAGVRFSAVKALQKVTDSGVSLQNPGRLADERWGILPSPHRLSFQRIGGGENRLLESWQRRLWERTSQAPVLQGLQWAVWHGELKGLPFWLIEKYRELGLLPVLALSGQHLWALAFVLGVLIERIRYWYKPRSGFSLVFCRQLQQLMLAGFLLALAPQEHSLFRTFFCVALSFFIGRNPLRFSKPYTTALGCGFLLLAFPELLASVGFLLSGVGVLGVQLAQECFHQSQKLRTALWLLFWFSGVMAFFFSQWISWGVFQQMVMGAIWEQILLPIAFLGGLLIMGGPEWVYPVIVSGWEWGLKYWIHWESKHVTTFSFPIYRPRVEEMLLFWGWLVALALWNRRSCQSVPK